MTGTELWGAFERDPRVPQFAHLRASDADREVIRRVLVDAYAEGRLDRGEFDDRCDDLIAAKTLGTLPALVADLVPPAHVPAVMSAMSGRTATDLRRQAEESYRQRLRRAKETFVWVSLLCWVVWLAIWLGTGADFPWPWFVMLGTGLRAARVRWDHEAIVERQEQKLRRRLDKRLARAAMPPPPPPPPGGYPPPPSPGQRW